MPILAGPSTDPKCFIAMPISMRKGDVETYRGDVEHWKHVMEQLFVPAIVGAGYEPVLPLSTGSELIHARIVQQLAECDLVLCDLSANNPNVFFEMGVRTSFDLPIALVWDGLTSLPFDTSGINTHKYGPALNLWEHESEKDALVRHILDSADTCAGTNPMWKQFGVRIKAEEPHSDANPLEAKVDVLSQQIGQLMDEQRNRVPTRPRLRHPALTDPDYAFTKKQSVLQFVAERILMSADEAGYPVGLVLDESLGEITISPARGGGPIPGRFQAQVNALASEFDVRYRFDRQPWDEPVQYSIADDLDLKDPHMDALSREITTDEDD
jgi:hypothetical protein